MKPAVQGTSCNNSLEKRLSAVSSPPQTFSKTYIPQKYLTELKQDDHLWNLFRECQAKTYERFVSVRNQITTEIRQAVEQSQNEQERTMLVERLEQSIEWVLHKFMSIEEEKFYELYHRLNPTQKIKYE